MPPCAPCVTQCVDGTNERTNEAIVIAIIVIGGQPPEAGCPADGFRSRLAKISRSFSVSPAAKQTSDATIKRSVHGIPSIKSSIHPCIHPTKTKNEKERNNETTKPNKTVPETMRIPRTIPTGDFHSQTRKDKISASLSRITFLFSQNLISFDCKRKKTKQPFRSLTTLSSSSSLAKSEGSSAASVSASATIFQKKKLQLTYS